MKCSRCKTVELKIQVKGDDTDPVEIDVCSACGGIWLDASELAKLDDNFFVNMEAIPYSPAAVSETDNIVNCPRCADTFLFKVHPEGHEDVVVDKCPLCGGFWLDKGELEKLRAVSDKVLMNSLFE